MFFSACQRPNGHQEIESGMEFIPSSLNTFAQQYIRPPFKRKYCCHGNVESRRCFPFTSHGGKLDILDCSFSLGTASDQLSEIMKNAVLECQEDESLPIDLIRGLLEGPLVPSPLTKEEVYACDEGYNLDGTVVVFHSEAADHGDTKRILSQMKKEAFTTHTNDTLFFRGMPRRPFYKELSRRLVLLSRYYHLTSRDDRTCTISSCFPRPLLSAETFGFTEADPPPIPTLSCTSSIVAATCKTWLQNGNSTSILQLLGMRQTPGSERWSFPPDNHQLLEAAQEPCSSHSKPPLLTVAARAHAKHAHRGSDAYFGQVTGTVMNKNALALEIVTNMIENAAWINCHEFGGSSRPVLEIRVKEGYGARWSVDWGTNDVIEEASTGHMRPTNVTFRGFLEPQMEDGFENNWKH